MNQSSILLTIVNIIVFGCIFVSFIWDFKKNNATFAFRKILSLIVYVGLFVLFVLSYNALIEENQDENIINQEKLLMGIMLLLIALIEIFVFTRSIFKLKNRKLIGYASVLMVISIIAGLFFAFVEAYYGMFILNDKWFIIDSEIAGSTGKTAFEFVYYTFSVTITYSGSGIELRGVVPKIFQMGQMIYFYFFAADAIFQLLRNNRRADTIKSEPLP